MFILCQVKKEIYKRVYQSFVSKLQNYVYLCLFCAKKGIKVNTPRVTSNLWDSYLCTYKYTQQNVTVYVSTV